MHVCVYDALCVAGHLGGFPTLVRYHHLGGGPLLGMERSRSHDCAERQDVGGDHDAPLPPELPSLPPLLALYLTPQLQLLLPANPDPGTDANLKPRPQRQPQAPILIRTLVLP